VTVYEGKLSGEDMQIAVVVGRFNDLITERLLAGALDCLHRHGVEDGGIDVAWVPGSFEIPAAARRMACTGKYDAIVCLGAVIRGATSHFEHIATQAAAGVSRVGLDTGIPTVFGVLTTDTIEQAIERAGAKSGNKGYLAALSAIEMANLFKALPGQDSRLPR
jgi:6,7-dimethyl-8-ribityllumazine synthase